MLKKDINLDVVGRARKANKSILGRRFDWTPFSVLNAMSGDWQRRKREWISLGIKSELGRGENLLKFSDTVSYQIDEDGKKTVGKGRQGKAQSYRMDQYIDDYRPPKNGKEYHAQPGGGPSHKSVWLGSKGKPVGGEESINARKNGETAYNKTGLTYGMTMHPYDNFESPATQSGTSIFDPTLVEILIKWFTKETDTVLDPFAGGSVRGIVSAILNRIYVGVDLRSEQILANEIQAEEICPNNPPFWLEGDSRNIADIVDYSTKADFILSCPPYFDLELYSGDKRDLSNCTWEEFKEDYTGIIRDCCSLLRNNRFAVFVVGDIRDRDGYYRCIPSLTIEAFEKAGLRLYNELILCTATGSLPLRVNKQFQGSRKVGKSHQNVLCFIKGDAKKAAARLSKVEASNAGYSD